MTFNSAYDPLYTHYVQAEEVHLWRRRRKWTQTELANALGVSRQAVANWENGRSRTPKNLYECLSKLAMDLAPPVARRDPDFVTPTSAPELFYSVGTGRGAVRCTSMFHPRWLIKHGYLDLAQCGLEMDDDRIPYAVLKHPVYKAACELYKIHNPTAR